MLPALRHVLHREPRVVPDPGGQLGVHVPAPPQHVRPGHDQVQAGPRQEEGQGQGEKCRKQEKQVRK